VFTRDAIGSENILAEVDPAKALYRLVNRPHLIPIVFPGGRLPEPLSRVWAQVLPSRPSPQELAAKINTLIAGQPLDPRRTLAEFPGDLVTLPWLFEPG
jgi:hypothetical protein